MGLYEVGLLGFKKKINIWKVDTRTNGQMDDRKRRSEKLD